ncbi:uncharacterized protein LOC133905394 [Phragmites australis]|uniref:uncharacterized protein LOC133905394 n=1 Tax=Phragmites australis TaxID=29695 RepID=UPI002D77DD2B|nr:uncharacterized protein LOC133905394 [Phragmites australis]
MASSSATTSNPLFGFQVSEKLGKQNHALWSAQVLAAIRGARLDGYIDGTAAAPPAQIERKEGEKGDKVTMISNPAYQEWIAADQQVLGFLFSSVSRDVLMQIATSKTAREAWRAIASMFTSQTRARSLNIKLSLVTMQKGNLSISEYFVKMKALGDEVAASGKPLDEEDLVAYILNGLDEDYEPAISGLMTRVEPVTLGELYSVLLNFENRQALRNSTSSANAANRGRGVPPNRGGAGRGRGNGWRGKNGNNKQRVDNRPICQVCYKRGHAAPECWHRFDETYTPDERHVAAATHAAYGVDTNWYLDTGATDHITGELDKLSVRERYKGNDQIHAANGAKFRRSKDGAFHFPVFHRTHPCLEQSSIHAASVSDAGTVIGSDKIHKGKYFMAISLGTPAVFNLVTIDTGSTLSWVNCERCLIRCHEQVAEAGPKFDPQNSTTYQHIGCSSQDCIDLQNDNGVPYGCIEETDTCIYSVRYGSQYSAGKLGRDRLALGTNYSIVDDFIFGCSEDDRFYGYEAGVIGFGYKKYSFFNQVARQASYNAFAYCFPSDHATEGFLTIGSYPPSGLELVTPLIGGYQHRSYSHLYSIQQLDMMVDGKPLEVDRSVYTRQMMILDSGTDDTFISSPIFYAFDKAMTAAMRDKGYGREYGEKVCFRSAGGEPVNWRGLPTVEMKFIRATLTLPPENVFHEQPTVDRICLAFQPDVAGVKGVQIFGNKATRSFRVVYDLQKMTFGFQARAC